MSVHKIIRLRSHNNYLSTMFMCDAPFMDIFHYVMEFAETFELE